METQDLTAHLRTATTDITPRPGFTTAVVRGGRRRRLRRRAGTAAAVIAAIALTGGGTYAVIANDTVTGNEIMAGWLAGPTKGDLAGDQGFVDQAVRVWETGQSRSPNASAGVFDDLRGTPHVYWAGDTPAGQAAVVMQQAYLHPHEQLPPTAADTLQTLVGLVATDPKDGKVKLVGDQFQAKPSDALPGYFMFGPEDHVLLVVDRGEPVWEQSSGGPRHRVPMTDGVGIVAYRLSENPVSSISGPDPKLESAKEMPFVLASDYLGAAEAGGTGPLSPAWDLILWWGENWAVGPSADFGPDPLTAYQNAVAAGLPRRLGVDDWTIRTGLGDGRTMLVGAVKEGDYPWIVRAVLVTPQQPNVIHDGGVINRHLPLPVRLRIPTEQGGWLVADKGRTLSYRTNGGWIPAGTSVALLPDDATQVKVDDAVVDLE